MYKTTARRRRAGAALPPVLAVLLVLTLLAALLLTGCSKDPKPDDTPAQSTPAPQEQTTATPDTAAGTAGPETTLPPETEPTQETLPPDWDPALNRTDISFFGAGETFVLTVPGAPANLEILWRAENGEIASVDGNGRVTAVGPGSARVYAEIAGYKLTCWVRCQFDAPPAEGEPALNNTDISFFGVGESYWLSVSNVPEEQQILWTSEDYGVASVDEKGRVRAVGPGTIRVKAQVGDTVLSCWVRCHFTAPDLPRSSIADGKWLLHLFKDRVTAQEGAEGVFVAEAELLSRIQVPGELLEGLEPYAKLDLSGFGMENFRVSSVEFSADGNTCAVTAEDVNLLFTRGDNGLWTLVDATGEARYYVSGTARLVFTDDSKIYEQRGADEGSLNRRADVLDLFGKEAGYENELFPVGVKISDGLVTEAVWYYKP